jgi:hypothetical protein
MVTVTVLLGVTRRTVVAVRTRVVYRSVKVLVRVSPKPSCVCRTAYLVGV